MARFDSDPKPGGDERPSDRSAENSPAVGSDLSAPPGAGPVASLPQDDAIPVGKVPAEDDLLAAVTSISSDAPTNIDQTLDQLTSSTDLFDIPAIDFDA
jgi:hypothetical protein